MNKGNGVEKSNGNKDEMTECLEILQETNQTLYPAALEKLRTNLKKNFCILFYSHAPSFKICNLQYQILKKVYETIQDEEVKKSCAEILSAYACRLWISSEVLKYKMIGSDRNIDEWGCDYATILSSEIRKVLAPSNNVKLSIPESNKILELTKQTISCLIFHHDVAEVYRLVSAIDRFDLLVEAIDRCSHSEITTELENQRFYSSNESIKEKIMRCQYEICKKFENWRSAMPFALTLKDESLVRELLLQSPEGTFKDYPNDFVQSFKTGFIESSSGNVNGDSDNNENSQNLENDHASTDKVSSAPTGRLEPLKKLVVATFGYFFKTFAIIALAVTLLALLYCMLVLHKPSEAFVSRYTQDFIYPFMRSLRVLTLPIIQWFPFLTNIYEESCVLTNPFFRTEEMRECWSCESVRHVIDLTGFSNFSAAYHNSGTPFVVKDAIRSEVEISDLRKLYAQNQEAFPSKTLLESNYDGINTLADLMGTNAQLPCNIDMHLTWNINRVTWARILRKHFPKPYFIPPTTEVSVQHYLFMDSSVSKSYSYPLTEFANVFVSQASGSRLIVLIPADTCQQICKVVSTVLQPKDVLFYNWLFWRPMSIALKNPEGACSMTYLGSFY